MNDKQFPPEHWQRLVNPERKKWMNPEVLLNHLPLNRNQIWMDYGCGPGYFTLPLAERVRTVYAVDISNQMLAALQQQMGQAGIANCIPLQVGPGDIPKNIPLLHGILMVNVFHEIEHPARTLRNLSRLMMPGGIVVCVDWKAIPMEMGPPLDHRIPEKNIIETFLSVGWIFQQSLPIYDYHYVLIFHK